MKPRYRIIEYKGKFYPQKRIRWLFWNWWSCIFVSDDGCGYGYPTLEEAEVNLEKFRNPPKPTEKVIKEYV